MVSEKPFSSFWPSICSSGKWDNEAATSEGCAPPPRSWNPTRPMWQPHSLESRPGHHPLAPCPCQLRDLHTNWLGQPLRTCLYLWKGEEQDLPEGPVGSGEPRDFQHCPGLGMGYTAPHCGACDHAWLAGQVPWEPQFAGDTTPGSSAQSGDEVGGDRRGVSRSQSSLGATGAPSHRGTHTPGLREGVLAQLPPSSAWGHSQGLIPEARAQERGGSI